MPAAFKSWTLCLLLISLLSGCKSETASRPSPAGSSTTTESSMTPPNKSVDQEEHPDKTFPTPSPIPTPSPFPNGEGVGGLAPPKPQASLPNTEVLKKDCQQLVSGELAFNPDATMHQGESKIVSARLSRGTDATITQGLGSGVVIQNTQVSCMVSLKLSSEEDGAFTVVNIPEGRSDDQILRADNYAQWDWRVTPLKAGTLHLLLYVTPMLYIDGVGQGLTEFPQPLRLITVTPDRIYAITQFCNAHWVVLSTLLTVIVIPLVVWGYGKWTARQAAEKEKKKTVGFGPHK